MVVGDLGPRPAISPGDLAWSAPAWPFHFSPTSEPIHSSLPETLRGEISPGDLRRPDWVYILPPLIHTLVVTGNPK